MVASYVLLLILVFLSETALGMRPLSEIASGAGKATLIQPARQKATILRTSTGAERRLLANSFVEATDALGLATTLVGANSLLAVDASSVVYTGATSASGIFQLDGSHALNSEYGISSGVVLTCGSGELSIETENLAESSFTINGEPGDSLLSQINNGTTNDASILDFKGTAQGNGQLTFQYVFGSEEYLEYVDAFNDIFALFVKVGNGAFTPRDNVALASDGKAVSIDNVNPNSNAAQYVDNFADNSTHHIAYDGYTRLLTTAPISVSMGDTVHIRSNTKVKLTGLY
ncbi:hypothetical protein KFL_002660130 [Klebsormidium nitens]|uniref:Uncharacterized protein n=1 Tax=Klebsormidium nitens TaxID=105231 RepID=A0A1Y1I504_KLENI|nr:hypothetical protein KFL_002660130 [Klebsormidium nitens]|eukprot:GAQ86034.1 hypothetical protein KFL_002660130 [Klebsormidium nitens]